MRDAAGQHDGFDLGVSFEDTIFMRDPDGRTAHCVVRFMVLAEDMS